MQFDSMSIVVGDYSCNAACPFCIGKKNAFFSLNRHDVNWKNFNAACRLACRSVDNVILTGKGEPTLWPSLLLQYLDAMEPYNFPLVTLITNGLASNSGVDAVLDHQRLDMVALSVVHYDPIKNNTMMGITQYNFMDRIAYLNHKRMPVRLSFTLVKGGVESVSDLDAIVAMELKYGLELSQVTLRPVYGAPAISVDVRPLQKHLDTNAFCVHREPWGLSVYDYCGLNIALTTCQTETEGSKKRQLIFWPNGQLTYSWAHKGARIL